MIDRVTEPPGSARAALSARAARFSLARGGLGALLERRMHRAARPGWRAAAALVSIAWLPLAALALARADAAATRSFLLDLATHARCLIAIPMYVAAERLLDEHFAASARAVVDGGLLARDDYDGFARDMDRAERACRSRVAAVVMAVLALAGSATALAAHDATATAPWVVRAAGGGVSAAGAWQLVVSLPAFRYLTMLWLWRWLVWSWFLVRLARRDLRLIATHPDNAAGLRVLVTPAVGLSVVIAALSAVLSAAWTRVVLFEHGRAAAYQSTLLAYVAIVVLLTLGPLAVFVPKLLAAKQRDLVRYASLLHEYMRYFDRRWIGRGAPFSEETLVQIPSETMANLGVGYESVRRTRLVPFDKRTVLVIAFAVLAPMAPLALTAVPFHEIMPRLLRAFV